LSGAYHGFDSMMDIQSYQGHTVGHSQKAANESHKHMREFLSIDKDVINEKKESSKDRNLDIPIE